MEHDRNNLERFVFSPLASALAEEVDPEAANSRVVSASPGLLVTTTPAFRSTLLATW